MHRLSNALFLSREVYGDGPEWEMEELELIKRYADRKTIIHKAHTVNEDIRAIRIDQNHRTFFDDSCKLPYGLRPPSLFGMGKDWYAAAAVSYYRNIIDWKRLSYMRQFAWMDVMRTDVYTWVMIKDIDEGLSREVLKVKEELRRINGLF